MGRPMSLFPRSKSGSKYSSGVMAVGLVAVAYSIVMSYNSMPTGLADWNRFSLHKWIHVSPLERLCAAPRYRAETLKCFFHLTKENELFSTVTQKCKHNPQLTFYPGFLLVCQMLRPCPDDHVYIINAENLRKHPKTRAFRNRHATVITSTALVRITQKKSNFSEPLLQIHWWLLSFRFSSPRSQTCSWEDQIHISAPSFTGSFTLLRTYVFEKAASPVGATHHICSSFINETFQCKSHFKYCFMEI